MARNGFKFGSYCSTANRYEGNGLRSGFLVQARSFEWSAHHLMPTVMGGGSIFFTEPHAENCRSS